MIEPHCQSFDMYSFVRLSFAHRVLDKGTSAIFRSAAPTGAFDSLRDRHRPIAEALWAIVGCPRRDRIL